MTAEQFIKARLADLALAEAQHHGGIANVEAVAYVVRNRQRAQWCGGDWMELIERHEAYNGTPRPEEQKHIDLRDPLLRAFLAKIEDIYAGCADPYTEGALYYAELNACMMEFKANVVRDPAHHPLVARVGPVSFFR